MRCIRNVGVLLAICMCVCILCAASACADSAECIHRLCLLKNNDVPGIYRCGCTECGEVLFEVYEASVTGVAAAEKQGEECGHLFRIAGYLEKGTKESIGDYFHADAIWYECVCEVCGDSVEAFLTAEVMAEHTYSVWEGFHFPGEDYHAYVSHCDECGAINVQLFSCSIWEKGSCRDPHHTLLTKE